MSCDDTVKQGKKKTDLLYLTNGVCYHNHDQHETLLYKIIKLLKQNFNL